jgi:hypothetical protein
VQSNDRLRPGQKVVATRSSSQPAGRHPPAAASILALQRAVGNRAVVQRLMYGETKKKLFLPATYADQRLPWDGDRYLQARPTTAQDPTLIALVNRDGRVKEHLRKGMDLEALNEVEAFPDATLQTHGANLAEANAGQGLVNELRAVVIDHKRLMRHWHQTKYADPKSLDIRWVISSPDDFIPGRPDLGTVGTRVRAQIPGEQKGTTYWEYMCVLIALIKADGYGMVNRLTHTATTELEPAVQALQDYYLSNDVQFDDSSTRMQIMKEWGFELIFAGRSEWRDLPKHVPLKRGKYIFDIPGHTVQVDVERDLPMADKSLTNPKQCFTPQSEEDNYDQDELALPVTFIWAKSAG